jgi:hypothetical protein
VHLNKYVLALLAVSLIGCESVSSFIKERDDADEQAYVSNAQESCKRYGFTEKTDAFFQCVQNDVIAAKARDAKSAKHDDYVPSVPGAPSTRTSCTKTIMGMDCTTQ